MRKVIITTALAGSVAFIAGAGVASADQKLRFAIMPAVNDTYAAATTRGFSDEAKKVGVEPVAVVSNGDVQKMANNVNDAVIQHFDAVGLFAIDAVVGTTWVDQLVANKIAVAASGTNIGDPKEHGPTWVYPGLAAVVVADLVEAGRVAGKMALEVFPKDRPAKIAIVQGAPGYAVNDQHSQGVKEALDGAKAKYQIVADQPTDWSPEQGESVCQNILTANPDVDFIFSFADPMSIGCARAVKARNAHAKIISVTGGMQIGKEEIAAGNIYGGVCIRPELMGRKLFHALYDAVKSGDLKAGKFVDYPLVGYTKANLADCPAEW
jgi:ribose transport system substrate-binding protein